MSPLRGSSAVVRKLPHTSCFHNDDTRSSPVKASKPIEHQEVVPTSSANGAQVADATTSANESVQADNNPQSNSSERSDRSAQQTRGVKSRGSQTEDRCHDSESLVAESHSASGSNTLIRTTSSTDDVIRITKRRKIRDSETTEEVDVFLPSAFWSDHLDMISGTLRNISKKT